MDQVEHGPALVGEDPVLGRHIHDHIHLSKVTVRITGPRKVPVGHIGGCLSFCIVAVGEHPDLHPRTVHSKTQPGKVTPDGPVTLCSDRSDLRVDVPVGDSRINRAPQAQRTHPVQIHQPGNGEPAGGGPCFRISGKQFKTHGVQRGEHGGVFSFLGHHLDHHLRGSGSTGDPELEDEQ